MLLRIFITGLALTLLISVGCKKENTLNDPGASLSFSSDTVLFDTVFTAIGSATYKFKVYNNSSKKILIDKVALSGGTLSQFRYNIDGLPGPVVDKVEIPGKDSLFIFVEVTVDPLNVNSPMVVQDSILFFSGGKYKKVNLVAWGQDVHYINGRAICTQTWPNDKPYLIYNGILIDTLCTLTIQEGARIHFHPGSRMYVLGTLKVEGSAQNPVTFQGDRLEQYYRDIPSQWTGVWLMAGSQNNVIDHARIKNGILGLQVDSQVTASPTLHLKNTIVENMSMAALLGQGSGIFAENCVFTNCGQNLAALTIGGSYRFDHCTFANYWMENQRSTPSLLINNYYKDFAGNIQARPLNQADFRNCIIYGSVDNEVVIDRNNTAPFNYSFNYSVVKTEDVLPGTQIWYNVFPGFKDSLDDLELSTAGFAVDKGDPAILSPVTQFDIEGDARTGLPDLGAYEAD